MYPCFDFSDVTGAWCNVPGSVDDISGCCFRSTPIYTLGLTSCPAEWNLLGFYDSVIHLLDDGSHHRGFSLRSPPRVGVNNYLRILGRAKFNRDCMRKSFDLGIDEHVGIRRRQRREPGQTSKGKVILGIGR